MLGFIARSNLTTTNMNYLNKWKTPKSVIVIIFLLFWLWLCFCSMPEKLIVKGKSFEVNKGDTISTVYSFYFKKDIQIQGYVEKDSLALFKKIRTPEKLVYLKAHSL